MKSNNFLRRWYRGEADITERLSSIVSPISPEYQEPYLPQNDLSMLEKRVEQRRKLYVIAAGVLCAVFAGLMICAVGSLPVQGDPDAPTVNEVAQRYVEQGAAETGAVNTVAGMILDYRAFDTLGESFVLFTAMCCVTMLMTNINRKVKVYPTEVIRYREDPIVTTVCRFIVPSILVFGMYIILNGHLSPGGGFSGGAILSAGLIIYAMVWGEVQAAQVISRRVVRTVTFVSLGFYALSKTYSFYTGANGLHSIISPGTPGRILSGGLILPLNVAVGFVVCCTMYSFYMYFRKGQLK